MDRDTYDRMVYLRNRTLIYLYAYTAMMKIMYDFRPRGG